MVVTRRREVAARNAILNRGGSENKCNDVTASRFKKFEEIKSRRLEIQRLNREGVRKELLKLSAGEGHEANARRRKEKAELMLEKKKIEDQGLDYERIKSMHYTAEDVELWNEKQKEKIQNTNEGFTDYIQVQSRKHRKQVAKLRPNLSAYREIKEAEAKADAEGRSLAFSLLESRPTLEAIENVILDLKEQYVCYHFSKPLTFNKIRKRDRKRNTFSRRRTFDENDDVTYINERNMRFNNKMARAYDKYTEEIRANFERGTAI